MTDDALTAWLENGAKVDLKPDEAVAKRRADFRERFLAAINPDSDLGATQEEHDAVIAERVFDVVKEINALGEEEYCAVWFTFPSYTRAAIKKYVAIAREIT